MNRLFIISACSLLLFSCSNHTSESDCATRVSSLEQEVSTLRDSLQKMQTSIPSSTAVLVDSSTTVTDANTNASSANGNATSGGRSMYKAGKSRAASTGGHHVGGEFPEGSERRLTTNDLKNLSQWGLKLIENEIYARHGMAFKDAELKEHFAGEKWYHNSNTNVAHKLTPIERDNIILIKSYKYVPAIQ